MQFAVSAVGVKERKKVFSASFPSLLCEDLDCLTEMGHIFDGAGSSAGYSCYGGGDGMAETCFGWIEWCGITAG